MGWSRTGISTAALLNFLAMGVGSFAWGALSDRFRHAGPVVLSGGVLLGLGPGCRRASRAPWFSSSSSSACWWGWPRAASTRPLISTTTRWFTENRSLAVALVSAGLGLGSTVMGPLARWIITGYDWRIAMLTMGNLAWLVIIPAAPARTRSRGAVARCRAGGDRRVSGGREYTAAQALRTPQFRRHRGHPLRVLRGSLGAHLPTWSPMPWTTA